MPDTSCAFCGTPEKYDGVICCQGRAEYVREKERVAQVRQTLDREVRRVPDETIETIPFEQVAIPSGLWTSPPMPMKKWRCTHGHKWESPVRIVGVELAGDYWGLAPGERLSFCGTCLVELLKERVGQVREDT